MKEIKKLNAKLCDAVKEPGKYVDGGGLYLFVTKAGNKSWRYDYVFGEKRYTLTYGMYPTISLKEARERHEKAKLMKASGLNPAAEKKAQREEQKLKNEAKNRTFKVVAMEWFESYQSGNVERTRKSTLQRMERHIFPALGSIPFSDLTFGVLREHVKKLESKGYNDEHRRVARIINQICIFAKINNWSENNIADGLMLILKRRPTREKHSWPAITNKDGVAEMLRRIYEFVNRNNATSISMRSALQLYPITGLRAQELAKAEWKEIDFENKLWKVPENHMKKERPLIIPLPEQAIRIFRNLYEHRTSNKYIFPSGGKSGHLTSDGINKAMHQAGVPKGEMTLHGWRKVFSTLAHEEGVPHEIVEISIAHKVGNEVAMIYNHAQYIQQRTKFMQWWADYLDCLREGKETPKYE